MKRIYLAVTNDLTFDQRMIRICTSLSREYRVTLVGRVMPNSIPLKEMPFSQERLKCFFKKGKRFYAEFNLRLLFYLLSRRLDIVCAIDLDTILACYWCSRIKGAHRVYDAHELFCEMKEVVSRPRVYNFWKRIEKYCVPRFKNGYTVNTPIASEFYRMYQVGYQVVRNVPLLKPAEIPQRDKKLVLYQGAVNEGRSFETLIPAMKQVDAELMICGDGNFLRQAHQLVEDHDLHSKVRFAGKVEPSRLLEITLRASVGITLFEKKGLSNYLSLANRFFDYMHAAVPQLCVDYPAYREINNRYRIAVLITDLSSSAIADGLNALLTDQMLYSELQKNCLTARENLNWQNEEGILMDFYKNLF